MEAVASDELPADDQATVEAALPQPLCDVPPDSGVVSLAVIEPSGRTIDAFRGHDDSRFRARRSLGSADGVLRWMQSINRRRGQFAHELSGPVSGGLAALETVIEFEEINSTTRDLLEDARRSMLRLGRMLEDRTVLLTRDENLTTGKTNEILSEAVELSKPPMPLFTVETEASDEPLHVDRSVLLGALAVLLGNVWTYRVSRSAHATVSADLVGEWLRVDVSDTGRTLEEAQLARVGELGFSTRPKGAGCGLFMLRHALARNGGGAVWVRSRDVGTHITVFQRRH